MLSKYILLHLCTIVQLIAQLKKFTRHVYFFSETPYNVVSFVILGYVLHVIPFTFPVVLIVDSYQDRRSNVANFPFVVSL
jgi:hypothetical protein